MPDPHVAKLQQMVRSQAAALVVVIRDEACPRGDPGPPARDDGGYPGSGHHRLTGLGGDHEAVRRWRLKQALGRTWLKRPALLKARTLTSEEQELLDEFKKTWASEKQIS